MTTTGPVPYSAMLDLVAGSEAQRRTAALPCPYGDGRTGERVVRALHDAAAAGLLELAEPDWVDRAPPT